MVIFGRRGRGYIPAMSLAELRRLPRGENMRSIGTLWGDLASDEKWFKSAACHAEELQKTEPELAAGRIEVVYWENAKKERRKRF